MKAMSTSLFSEVATDQESLEGIVSNNRSENRNNNNFPLSNAIVDMDSDDAVNSPTINANELAELTAPPLDFAKYLTMQKKRVNLTIRYSAESGLKPYYLTIAKRVKDHFPDVLIEKIELDKEGGGGGDAESKSNNGETGARTFEVVVDGKIVVRTNQKDGDRESIFVSMTELEFAIARARKRRRPSSVYGENGNMVMSLKSGDKDEFDNSRLEFLKQKALELQRNNSGAGSKKKSAGSSKKKIAVDSTE